MNKPLTRAEKAKADADKKLQERLAATAKRNSDADDTADKNTKLAEKKAAAKEEPADHQVKHIKTLPEAIKAVTHLLQNLPKKKHFILEFSSLIDGGYQVSCHENGDIE